jgi:hypothetical protein
MLPAYHERPGRYFLPSGLSPVQITKLLTNPFFLFYLVLNFKLPVLVLIWGLEQKKLGSEFPQKVGVGSKPSGTRIAMILSDYAEKLEQILVDMREVVSNVTHLRRYPE